MRGEDPFAGFERDVEYWELPDRAETLAVREPDLPEGDRELRFVVYLGLFDLLADALWEACEDDDERRREAVRVLSRYESVEPPVRFSLFEGADTARRTELMSRMRGKEVAVTEAFLIPRLEHGLLQYEDRVAALRAALRGP